MVGARQMVAPFSVAAGLAAALCCVTPASADGARAYPWLKASPTDSILQRFAPPPGFVRVRTAPGSFGDWLRGLPLKPAGTLVRLYSGELKSNQSVHAAVVDIDIGRRDLQQCADAVMRLRAEYLYARGGAAWRGIAFNFTSGDRVPYSRWMRGQRPVVRGRTVVWRRGGTRGPGRESFRAYLRTVFTYAGTWSLSRELTPVARAGDVRIGDVFIQGGFPGHAVIVVDAARDRDGRIAFLLAQSFMPAQNIHVLKAPSGGHWYVTPVGAALQTPEWTFKAGSHKRFARSPRS